MGTHTSSAPQNSPRGGRSKAADRFHRINKNIKITISDLLKTNITWINYIDFYRWIDQLDKMLIRMPKEYPDDYKKYSENISRCGLYKVDFNRIDSEDASSPKRNRVHFTADNNVNTQNRAANHIRKTFHTFEQMAGKEDGFLLKKIDTLIQKGLEGFLATYAKEQFSEELYKIKRNSGGDNDFLNLFARLLIYSLSGELSSSGSQRDDARINIDRPNIYMDTKEKLQEKFSLEDRYQGASRIVIINYAGTSFLTGRLLVKNSNPEWNDWFDRTTKGDTEIHIVLTDPASPAAKDAEQYKMKPKILRCKSEEIISNNIDELRRHMAKYPDSNLRAYITELSLPCAYIKAEFHNNPDLDNIKVDIYLPIYTNYVTDPDGNYQLENPDICDDTVRQSFMVLKRETPDLYNSFSANIEAILKHAEKMDLKY